MANPALIDELEKQFRDNPRRVFARLANEYRKAGDFMRAIEICHAHVPQQPGYISGHIVLGQALYDAGELDQAQQTFQTALSLDPENLIALRQLGDIARNRRDYRDARSWYTRLLEVDPQNDEIVAQLGEIALAEGDDGARGGVAAAEAQVEEDQGAVATAVALEDDAPVAESTDASDEPTDAMSHNDVGALLDAAQASSSSDDRAAMPEFTEVRGHEPEAASEFTIDTDAMVAEEQPAASANESAPMSGEPDDEDVAWIESESERMESLEFIVSDADEADTTDYVVSEAAQDDEQSVAPPTDDFDFAFETEEFDEPLRPHTGEALSVIAEEDALAGVQPTRTSDRTPFGEPIGAKSERPEEPEVTESSFEPLPIEDLEAAAAELPPVEELEGEDLAQEMTRWSSDAPDAEAPHAGDTPDESLAPAEPDVSPEDPHADTFIVSEAETIIEETIIAESIVADPRSAEPVVEQAIVDAGWDAPADAGAPDEVPVGSQGAGAAPDAGTQGEGGDAIDALFPAEPDDEIDALFDTSNAPPQDAHASVGAQPDAATQEPVSAAFDEGAAFLAGQPAEAEDIAPATFVTETMAELYLQQGFRNEALDVYRKLAAQSPDDASLRDKIAHLEKGPASAPDRQASDAGAEPMPALQRSAASFFKSLASVEPPPPPTPDEPESSDEGQWEAMLSETGEVDEADDAAAVALSNGFHAPAPRGAATRAADSKMSLHDIFGSNQADRGTSAGSLDAFFTPEGERTTNPQSGEEGREDLEAFNAWLEGLKK